MSRLSNATLADLPQGVGRPDYDRDAMRIGVVHFGPGAFHRAHQAPVYDALNAVDARWGIIGVSLNSRGVADALNPQDGLYALALLDAEPETRVIGSIARVLTADQRDAILDAVAAPDTRIVSATVTEKGYCLSGDGSLDMDHPAVAHDLAGDGAPRSFVAWLVAGLAERRRRGAGGLTIMSCDNLSDNGRKLGAATVAFARARDKDLADWIEREVRFPNAMVDSITPATDDAVRASVDVTLGVTDAWPIQRERFTQWVVEDDFAPGERPDLAAAGVTLTDDVRGYEHAKLRLLNGAHSTLAYLGVALGHETVADAMDDARLARFVEQLMREDIAPSLNPPAALDLNGYIDAILRRFGNRAIAHRLIQIAADGSQKLPYRILDTVRDARAAGRPVDRLAVPIAAWLRFLERDHPGLADPMADRLRGRPWRENLAVEAVFGDLSQDAVFVDALARAHAALGDPAGFA
ncbi:mannitol dehydrogenase family protein [Sphingomonas sp.]|uniref:mannitol dehydrogenase family protein n=1 Tax=Sphingomonas sp. TaxID=28214 RepID=UPI002C471DE7|nr:mannitol dehydrogenase family protein [Sphingomonas sp.]HTG37801.1 mannitol dehydrogenase family protein [Sphingomonas sp.]